MAEETGVKITLLPSAANPADGDVLAGVQSNLTKKFPLSALAAYFLTKVTPAGIGAAKPANIGYLTLSTTWTGSASPYSQTVTVTGAAVTAASKVDIQLTAVQIESLISDGVTGLVIENNSGTLTVYAVGAAPSASMTVQCTVEETA